MGNRGSKSGIPVKEQRVDGTGYVIFITYLRCILGAFERRYNELYKQWVFY